MGALTRGDRQAASGLDLSRFNVDSPLGQKALKTMYEAIVMEATQLPQGVTLVGLLEGCDLDDLGLPVPAGKVCDIGGIVVLVVLWCWWLICHMMVVVVVVYIYIEREDPYTTRAPPRLLTHPTHPHPHPHPPPTHTLSST